MPGKHAMMMALSGNDPLWRYPPIVATLTSLLLHGATLWLLWWRPSLVMPTVAPAAVMLEYAPDFQVALLNEPLPPGVNQQRRTEAAAEQISTPDNDPTPAEAEHAELEKRQQRQVKTEKKPQDKKPDQKPQPAVAGNSTITSRAAPPVQPVIASHTTAPIESDASQMAAMVLSWEALVKAKINRVKRYPADAERRGRSGNVLVSFTVNAQGKVLVNSVRRSSGTSSLDRAALAAVENAQPLPAPPPELLNAGVHKVLMPVHFSLQKN